MVMAGAAVGGLCRYLVTTAVMQRYTGRLPLGTVIANVTGCFLIGVLMTVLTKRLDPHPYWRLLLVVGGLGGYTTFSSFEYETFQAAQNGVSLIALGNMAISVLLGYLGVWAGVYLAGGD
ncbi:MAG: fluoride efflux transporter CrcB [Bryobacterales bacterium]|nr:fluoride efflux transporter CrcB [Bryobacterales bacterium]